jgi:hypothetical protein
MWMDNTLLMVAAITAGILVLWLGFKLIKKLIKVILVILIILIIAVVVYFRMI